MSSDLMSLFLAIQKEDKNTSEGAIPTEMCLGTNNEVQKQTFTLDRDANAKPQLNVQSTLLPHGVDPLSEKIRYN